MLLMVARLGVVVPCSLALLRCAVTVTRLQVLSPACVTGAREHDGELASV